MNLNQFLICHSQSPFYQSHADPSWEFPNKSNQMQASQKHLQSNLNSKQLQDSPVFECEYTIRQNQ